MVTLKEVSKAYSENGAGAWVLDHVNLSLKKGDFLYVVGGSGAGKTTLLRLIALEEAPSRGMLSLFGYELGRISPNTVRAVRRAVGYVPQRADLLPDLSVQENILLPFLGQSVSAETRIRLDELLGAFGLISKRARACAELSGGEAQRVAVARALIGTPELIIADEPTGAQDREYTWALMEQLALANARGATVIVATHDQEIVRRVRKPCAILKDGRVRLEETVCYF